MLSPHLNQSAVRSNDSQAFPIMPWVLCERAAAAHQSQDIVAHMCVISA